MGAVDDVRIELETDENRPERSFVRIANSNTSKSVIATVKVEGAPNFRVSTFSGGVSRDYLPRQFEVRVPPGGTTSIGFSTNRKYKTWDPKPEWELVELTYSIPGARYVRQEPLPQPPAPKDADQYLFRYSVPTRSGKLLYALNLNHLYAVRFDVWKDGAFQVRQELVPMGQKNSIEFTGGGGFIAKNVVFYEWNGQVSEIAQFD